MSNLLRRTSFTTRLVILAAAVLTALVVVDYIALLRLPARVARDTVEVALRENVQALNATMSEDRDALRERTSDFIEDPVVKQAIVRKDRATLVPLMRSKLGPDIDVVFQDASYINGSGLGSITAPVGIPSASRSYPAIFY